MSPDGIVFLVLAALTAMGFGFELRRVTSDLSRERARNAGAQAAERARLDRMHAELLVLVDRCNDLDRIANERHRLCDPHATGTCQASPDFAAEAWAIKMSCGRVLDRLAAR